MFLYAFDLKQIHRDRPDAMCVAHLHAPHARALAGKEIKPVFLHGSFLCTGVPTWNNPRLVVNDAQAADLSRTLGQHRCAQMRGHGSVVVGASAEEAFFAARSWRRTRKSSVCSQIGLELIRSPNVRSAPDNGANADLSAGPRSAISRPQ